MKTSLHQDSRFQLWVSRNFCCALPAVLGALVVLGFAVADASAQLNDSFSQLYAFSGPDGGGPTGTLIQGADGNFYGTTQGSLSNISPVPDPATNGTVFSVTPSGALTTRHVFSGTDGAHQAAMSPSFWSVAARSRTRHSRSRSI